MGEAALQCWNCGTELTDLPRPVSRHAACPECFEELHCCRMCRHYRPDISGQCDEDRADPPIRKENANFCDWYRPRMGAYQASRGESASSARAQLDALFGGSDADTEEAQEPDAQEKIPADAAGEARARLDALFGDNDDSSPVAGKDEN